MTALDHNFLNEVRAATGFQDIELRGGHAIVNPLTGRTYNLRTPGRRDRYLQSVSLKVDRARKLQAERLEQLLCADPPCHTAGVFRTEQESTFSHSLGLI